ncbi:MAG: TIM barrel protein [Bauldia sp.]
MRAPMPRFSANLGFLWPDRPLIERIKAAAGAGFKAVELHFPYDVSASAVKASCARNDVRLLGINTAIGEGTNGHRGLGAVAGREKEFQALIDQSIAYAREAGGTSVHAMAGLAAEEDRAAGAEAFVGNLKAAARKAAPAGLTILLEPLNAHDMPGYFYTRVEEACEIIDRVGEPNVKLMFDAYHVARAEGDVLTRLKLFYDRIGHVQIAGVPSRAEPDEGEIAYGAVFAALDELGYAGWVGCEYRPRAGTDEGLGWTKALGVAL